jgi:hypothetical protein
MGREAVAGVFSGITVAWQDRDYYRGGEDYFANPAAILGFSVPFGTWFSVRVRLHFWLLLTIVFGVAAAVRGAGPVQIAVGIALLLVTLLLHDFAHKFFTQWQGGHHTEFMLWPAGGLIFPTIPPGAWPMFVVYGGPLVVHAVIAVACILAAGLPVSILGFNPLQGLAWTVFSPGSLGFRSILYIFARTNWMLLLVNVLPYYWFDGGCLLQSILWPFTGNHRAINVTCIIGMILAVPMFFLSLMARDFFGMILWVLLFSSSYTRRRQLQASGSGDFEDAIAWSAQERGGAEPSGPRRRKWFQPGFAEQAAKRNAKIRRERERVDLILAKVSRSGMNSLNWWERRTLRKATEQQKRTSR